MDPVSSQSSFKMERGDRKGGQNDVSRIPLGIADFEDGERNHEDTGSLYKLKKAGKWTLF